MVCRYLSYDLESFDSLLSQYSSRVNSHFEWTEIDIVHVTKSLRLTLQESKRISSDRLDIRWLKNYVPLISIFLTTLLNRSLVTGIVSTLWKNVFIVSLNKITPPKTLSDTRPIANTSRLSKLFEQIIANQVVSYLEDNELLDKYQSGFRKHHSTQSALLKLVNDISLAMDENKLTV